MTVCIAAITSERYIVTLSDTKIGSLLSSTDVSTVKVEPFAKDWLLMTAADDFTQSLPVVDKAAEYFTNRANTLQVARSCVKKAFQNRLSEIAADTVLGRYQMDMNEFKKIGRRRFTETTFNSLSNRIDSVRGEWQFLGAGFDARSVPHLFTVEEPGLDHVYDRIGFCAIGSGRYAAEGMLMYLGQNTVKTLYETVFNVYAAKFMAEKVSGVGINSWFFVKKPGSTACVVRGYNIEKEMRKEWDEKCAPRASKEFIDELARLDVIRLL